MSQTLGFVFTVLLSYLMGGANGAIIVSRLCFHQDVRERGSGNAGLTNFYRCYGKKWMLPVLLTDLGKGMLSVYLGRKLLTPCGMGELGAAVGMVSCILGHMYPVWFQFRGGKGVLTGVGALMILDWRLAAVELGVFAILVALWRFVSLGSVAAALVLPAAAWFFGHSPFVTGLLSVCAFFVIWRHRSNIGRLLRGEENKLTLKK